MTTELSPFDPPYTTPNTSFGLPRGKYRGRYLSELTESELQNIWAGYNGSGDTVTAGILRAELDKRIANR